jgi:two-component system sensor histidine kinase ChiS
MRERTNLDSLASTYTSIDSLKQLQQKMDKEKNTIGSLIVQRHIGTLQRQTNDFSQALQTHVKCLSSTQALGDTLEMMRTFNELGIDYRDIGILDMALQYHYSALAISKDFNSNSNIVKESRAASLYELGNVYMLLGNYRIADSLVRVSLVNYTELNLSKGIADDYRNLGAIYQHDGKKDSAWMCYQKAMHNYQKAKFVMGISRTHTCFGSLYKQEGKDEQAIQEYKTAYQMMKDTKDEWHTLPPLIMLASLYVDNQQWSDALHYLDIAREIGERLKSFDYLKDIYNLYYIHYKRLGDYRNALLYHEKAGLARDTMISKSNLSHIQNVTLNMVNGAQNTLQQERTTNHRIYTFFAIFAEIMLAVVLILLYSQRLRKQTMKGMQHTANLREDFFTNIAHEFRTPLTVILGLTHSLQSDTHTQNSTKEKAKAIERQSNAILSIINQVISSKKLPTAIKDEEWRHGNISLFLEMIAQSHHDIAEHKSINYQFIKEAEVEMDFVPEYMEKIMNTLLDYAFKYTPKSGTVTATISREKDDLYLTVSDTGIGMPAEVANKVFTPYFLEEGNIKDIDTSIGLSTVKQIVDIAKGNITLQSDLGKGTTIHVTLPIHSDYALSPDTQQATAQVEEKTEEELPSNTHSQEKLPHLLVIEDNSDIANFISSIFTGQCDLSFSTDGNEGLQTAMDSIPDLIIIDRFVNRVDGLELCRQIRSNPVINHIPIIMITAKVTEQDQLECAKTGIAVYLSKPFTAEMLRTHVDNLLKGRDLMLKKFAEIYEERKVSPMGNTPPQTAVNLQFLHKVTDTIYLLIGSRKEVTVAALASKMCMSTSQFYRKMVAMTGMTPTTYIQRARIKKAMNLIDSRQGISLADVADQCGFDAYPNFVRSFKNVCGITPTDYRRGIDTKK